MSSTIDKRVVEMRFDNEQFESRTKTTLGTLEKLKNALTFSHAGDGLDKLQGAVKGFTFNPLAAGVEAVQVKFNALEAAAFTALQNIVNRAVNAGIEIAKSLTVSPVFDGYREYELELNSVQTIMNATGESLETVQGYLNELNTYADKTIYSFSDMTSAIGKFTNAGVDLDTAVKAIQGVSNATAYAGLGADAASSAFYNFAQALSTGYLGMQDFRSVGMTFPIVNKRFQQELVNTALEMGTLVDAGDHYVTTTANAQGSTAELQKDLSAFQYSLQAQWVTADVLTATLAKYSDETTELGQSANDAATKVKTFTQLMDTLKESIGSGWAQSFKILVGDFEEAKSLWTSVSEVLGDIVGRQADERNKLLSDWKNLGGRLALMEGISNTWEAFLAVVKPIQEAFRSIFPPKTAFDLLKITFIFRRFTECLMISSETAAKVKRVFTGFFSAISFGIDVIKEVGKTIKDALTPYIGEGATKVLDFAANVGDAVTNFRQWVKETGAIYRWMQNLTAAIKGGVSTLKNWYAQFKQLPWVQDAIKSVNTAFDELTKKIIAKFPNATKKLSELVNAFKIFWTTKDFSGIVGPIKEFASALKDDLLAAWDKLKQSDFFASFIEKLTNLWEKAKAAFDGLKEKFTGFGDTLGDFNTKIQDFGSRISAKMEELGGIFSPIADFLGDQIGNILAALMLLFTAKGIKSIVKGASTLVETIQNGVKLIMKPFEAIGGLFNAIKDALKSFSGAANAAKNALNGLVLLEVVLAIGALAYIMVKLKDYKPEDFKTGAIVVGALAIVVMAILGMIGWMNKQKAKIDPSVIKSQKDVGTKVLELAAALYLVVKSFSELYSILNGGNAIAAIGAAVGLIVAIGVLIGAMKILNKGDGLKNLNVKSLFAIIGAAGALKMIVDSFVDLYDALAYADWDSLKEPLIAFGGAVAALLLILNRISKTQEIKGVGSNLLLSVISLKVLISVLEDLTTLDLSGIADHIGSFILVVGSFGLLMKAVSKMSTSSGSSGVGLLAAAVAVRILVGAIKAVGQLELGEAVQGTIVVGAMLVFLGAFAKLANGADIPAKTALTFLALSVSIGILAVVIAALSLLNKEDVETGTLAIDSMILCIAALIAVAKNAGNIKVAPLFVLIAAFGILSAALILILAFADDNDAIMTAAAALDSLMVCFATLVGITGLVSKAGKDIAYGLVVVGVLTAVVAALAYIVYLMVTNITDVDAALKCAEMLSLIMAAMSLAMIGCAAVGVVGPMALVGLGIGVAVIAAAAGLLFAINKLVEDHPDIDSKLDRIGEVMYKIGDVFGQSIAGFLEGATSSLEQVGKNLSAFADSSSGFFDMLNGLKPEAAEGAKNLAAALLEISGADLVNTIVEKLGGGGFESFGTTLKTFGQALVDYSNVVTAEPGIDTDAITKSAEAGQALSDLQNSLPRTGGWWQDIAGSKDISNFGEKIGTFGQAIIDYNKLLAESTYKFDVDAIEDTADAGMALSDLQNSIPQSGGWWQNIVGTKDISNFGDKVKTFGEQIIAYAEAVNGFTYTDDSPTKAIVTCAEGLTGLATLIKENDSGKTLKDFGGDLSDFGLDVSDYYSYVSDVDVDKLSSVTTTLNDICTTATSLSGIDLTGAESFFDSLVSLATTDITSFAAEFGDNLQKFGKAIIDFVSIITTDPGVDSAAVEASENISSILSSLSESIPTSGAKWNDVFDETDMDDLGLSLSAWGRAVVAYSNAVTGQSFDKSAIKASIKASEALADLSDSIPREGRGWDGYFDPTSMMTLGETLAAFAGALNEYSNSISGFEYSGSPKDAVTCVNELSTLASTLKTNDVGDTIKKFGDKVKTLGEKLKNYYDSVSSIDTTTLSTVTTGISDFVSSLVEIDVSVIDSFTTSLSNLASNGIGRFTSAFYDSRSDVIVAVMDFITAATNAIGTSTDSFRDAGESASTAFADAFDAFEQKSKAIAAVIHLTDSMFTSLEHKKDEFSDKGEESAKKYIDKFQNQYRTAKTTGTVLASNIITGLSSVVDQFATIGERAAFGYVSAISSYSRNAYDAANSLLSNASSALSGSYDIAKSWGWNFSYGFIQGMSGWNKTSYNTAYDIGVSAVRGLMRGIDARSPSKEAKKAGDYFGIGFVTNMLRWVTQAGEAATELGSEAVSQLNQAIAKIPDMLSGGMDFDPVIRPIVDLTNAQQSVSDLNNMFNQSIGVAADIASITGTAVTAAKVRTTGGDQTVTDGAANNSKIAAPIYNTFNITGVDDPEEVATIVSRRIQKQVDRRKDTWAQSSGTGSPLIRSR